MKQLLAKAGQADAPALQGGLSIPEEIKRRHERKATLARTRAAIEARAHARSAAELADHEKKTAARRIRRCNLLGKSRRQFPFAA